MHRSFALLRMTTRSYDANLRDTSLGYSSRSRSSGLGFSLREGRTFFREGRVPGGRRWHQGAADLRRPVCTSVARHIKRELQPSPHSEFVEGGAQVVFDDLLAGSEHRGNVFIGQALPDQASDLNLLGG